MSVQTQQFRVVGVNTETGEDVSVVIDAGTKAAAEVKAEQMQIETTHIVRLKQDTPEPPTEHELFSSEAAEALVGKRTDKLIEEVVPPEEPKPAAPPTPPAAAPQEAPAHELVTAITRSAYGAGSNRREHNPTEVSSSRAIGFVLIVLFGITAGAYFVLIHQPNASNAQDANLVFGEDLFSDVVKPAVDTPSLDEQPRTKLRDAFTDQTTRPPAADPKGPPIAPDQQIKISPKTDGPKLKLQSVVTTNKGRFAVINGKLYKQGSAIGSTATLVSVADDWVLIERGGKQAVLKIQTSATKTAQ